MAVTALPPPAGSAPPAGAGPAPDEPDDAFAAEAHAWLAALTGRPGAAFRPDQLATIRALVVDRRRVLLVQRTGWGKSAVYFIATRMLRARGAGPTLLLSPLLALMRNQIEAAERMGLRAVTINSTNRDDWDSIADELAADTIDLLLVSAPRLANAAFQDQVLPIVRRQGGLLVVDEAHCISDWGHDFVPDYRRVVRVLDTLDPSVPVLGCTATANDRVVADIESQFGADLLTLRGPLGREGLELHVVDLPGQAERMAWLVDVLPGLPGSGIVYCLTVADAERVAAWLAAHGIASACYHGSTPAEERPAIEQALLADEVKVVVATAALGMGFDKPDLGFVVHFQAPGTPIAYYQQVGRAGRGLASSVGVLLRGAEDGDIQDWFISTAFPARAQAEAVVAHLEASGRPATVPALEAAVNVRRSRLEAMLKVLEVEGAVARSTDRRAPGWARTAQPWTYDTERVEAITAARRAEQQAMREYAATEGCRMVFLRGLLDDPRADACGICDRCRAPRFLLPLRADLVDEARSRLRSGWRTIEPRKLWPSGLDEPKGRIPAERQVRRGRALSLAGDGSWGRWIVDDRAAGGGYRPELVAALAELAAEWAPDPAPTWVTWVPSNRTPAVAQLAGAVADRLGLPAVGLIERTRTGRPQVDLFNSAQQVANVWGAYRVDVDAAPGGRLPAGPVLLVDDVVDSGWTMTTVGHDLARAGVLTVYPLALSTARGG
jgi:ATP-dependent DNA helicase RecQ